MRISDWSSDVCSSDLAQELARRIKNEVRAVTGGLVCSRGISPNKLLSKIGSELDKPDGLTILSADDLRRRIWQLPVGNINGIGPKANARLAEIGMFTISSEESSVGQEWVRTCRSRRSWINTKQKY